MLTNGPVDVVALACIVRDADRSDVERHDAAVDLIERCELRSLRDLIAVVFGDPPAITPGGFDAASDAWRTVETLSALV